MDAKVSRKLSYLQLLCALMIIGLHTTFPAYFDHAEGWALQLNTLVRRLDDAAIATFFFLTAYLLYRRQRTWKQVMLSRLRTLVLPYVLWNAVTYAHQLLVEYLSNGRLLAVPTALQVLQKLTVSPANKIFWFLLNVLGYAALYPVIRWCVQKKWPAIAAGAAALACVFAGWATYFTMAYWAPVYLLGAYVGCWHKQRIEQLPVCGRRWIYPLAAASLLALICFREANAVIYYGFWLAAPLLLWVLADAFACIPVRPWWVDTSFYLYCVHMVIERYAVKIYLAVFGTGQTAFVLCNVLLPLTLAAIALLGGAVVRRLTPPVWSAFTGMRERASK